MTTANELIDAEVDRLFERQGRFRRGDQRVNPVTGSRFLHGEDPIGLQKRDAKAALLAAHFRRSRPAGAPELPLTYEDREDLKAKGGLLYIIALYARSLAMRDYELDGHPEFGAYARGVVASPFTPEWIRDDPVLCAQFPPVPLAKLRGGLIWK
jgi:hypothetical protein